MDVETLLLTLIEEHTLKDFVGKGVKKVTLT